ncbi:MAG: HEAT repeat domain-containing protein [Planctomycetes bacterium]|nr:HEAT repeat domain-containing protein [Planctomycetota bacterium]
MEDNYNDFDTRLSAAKVLIKFGIKKAIPQINKFLLESGVTCFIRNDVSGLLGDLGPREFIPQLTELLKDKNARIREGATEALIKLKAKEALPQLFELLKYDTTSIKLDIIPLITQVEFKEAIPQLTELLKDTNQYMRIKTVEALAQLKARESISQITELLKDKSRFYCAGKFYGAPVLEETLKALVKLDAKESIPKIIELLNDDEPEIRGLTAITLVELGAKDKVTQEVIEDIKPILNWHENYATRARAALSRLEEPEK